ncbi:MAG: glycine zipper 2TM domain-containing protein [Candidatus Omnitrophica bacterium]|nr:glycine zipper 2TM domain-containing protein [Candidatus Omnitrophota bacterium]
MKKISAFSIAVLVILLNAGCQDTKTRAVEGGVIGGLLGATAGGIIGHQTHHGGEGAAIGLAAGAATGAIVGSQIQKPGQQTAAQAAAPQQQQQQYENPNQMSIQQVAQLAKQGIHEDVIIDKIRLSNSKYNLTPDDINYLKSQGVSQKVISVMQGLQ